MTTKYFNFLLFFSLKVLPYCYWVLVIMALLSGTAYASTDYLEGAGTAVSGTFGDNTTFEHLLYLGEAVGCAFTYMKTKSYYALIGLPVLMIVTHYYFTKAAPPA